MMVQSAKSAINAGMVSHNKPFTRKNKTPQKPTLVAHLLNRILQICSWFLVLSSLLLATKTSAELIAVRFLLNSAPGARLPIVDRIGRKNPRRQLHQQPI